MRYFIKLAYNGITIPRLAVPTERLVNSRNDEQGYFYLAQTQKSNMGAGRTDTGVHEMYAHFDFEAPFDIPSLVHKLNLLTKRYCDL
jgi:tRNA pseudouridine38-40 synthase